MKERIRGFFAAVTVVAAGIAMGSSALLFETEEATASTTRVYAVIQPQSMDLSSCIASANSAFKGTIATSTSDLADMSWGNCGGGQDCTNSCDSYEMWNDDDSDNTWDALETGKNFVRHNSVEIVTGGDTLQGPFGWLDNAPYHSDRATSISNLGSCYVRQCVGSECGGNSTKWTVDSDQNERCVDCLGLCVASGDFS